MISKWSFNGCPGEKICYKPELIENYDKAMADETQVWECHHRLETHNSDGKRRLVDLTRDELIALGMYYNRPSEELIFLMRDEHNKLHHTGKLCSEETKHKISMSNRNNPKQNCKGVICVETGAYYPSLNEAERHTGVDHSWISSVCRGKYKTAGGYHWAYV